MYKTPHRTKHPGIINNISEQIDILQIKKRKYDMAVAFINY